MRTVAEHRAALLSGLGPLAAVTLPTLEALGLVLARDVLAATDLPGFDNSAMDGYAVRAADLADASPEHPVTLAVHGDIAAGDTECHVLAPGQAMRIMTGAPLPRGADAVVPVERSDGGVHQAALTLAPERGRHIRRQAEDVRAGEVILRAGTRIGPGQVALVTAANVPTVSVHPRPRVAVFSTGDELARVGSALAHGQIVDSNGSMLAALVRAAGAQTATVGHLRDDADQVAALLVDVPGEPDLVLTTGGVSMGAYDTVKEVLAGAGVDFVKVAMRPGMPQGFGRVGPRHTPIVTLPGNPLSSLVSFHVYVLPMLRRLAGLPADADPADGTFEATALTGWSAAAGKVEWTRVVVERGPDGLGVRPSGGQGSHMLAALADGNALAMVPEACDEVRAGDRLRCLPLVGQEPVR